MTWQRDCGTRAAPWQVAYSVSPVQTCREVEVHCRRHGDFDSADRWRMLGDAIMSGQYRPCARDANAKVWLMFGGSNGSRP